MNDLAASSEVSKIGFTEKKSALRTAE